MRIVLQHVKSALYLKSPGVWTGDLMEAFDFGSSQNALKFVRQHRLMGVQVLVAFVDRTYIDTVALQIPSEQTLRPAA